LYLKSREVYFSQETDKEKSMKNEMDSVWRMFMCGGVGLLLLARMAGAQPPPLQLLTCIEERAECTANLGTCEGDLDECLAEPNAVFPGDGVQDPQLDYTDNGDGTVTDNNTLRMWEVKDDSDGVHDKDNTYTWSTNSEDPNGTLFTDFLVKLNNTCDGAGESDCDGTCDCGLAGFSDWRIPNVRELQSIVDYGRLNPAIHPDFPGETAAFGYWSSTVVAGNPTSAWFVFFSDGDVSFVVKSFALHGRAVRGGQ
jgi:hypothetical protein